MAPGVILLRVHPDMTFAVEDVNCQRKGFQEHINYYSSFTASVLYLYWYLYSAQYLHVLQDSKCHMTQPTVQVQSNSQITDIPLTERQRLKDEHLSTSLRFFDLPLGIGPNDRGPPF